MLHGALWLPRVISRVYNVHAFHLLATPTVEQLALKLGARVCAHCPEHGVRVDLSAWRHIARLVLGRATWLNLGPGCILTYRKDVSMQVCT